MRWYEKQQVADQGRGGGMSLPLNLVARGLSF